LPDEKVRLSDVARISTFDGSRSPQAIKAVKVVLELIKVSEEDPVSLTAVEAIGNRLLCNSCTAPIVMDFSCVIGHHKRHNEMNLTLISEDEARGLLKYPIPRGLCADLLGPELSAPRKRARKIYGCRHCHQDSERKEVLCQPSGNVQVVDIAQPLVNSVPERAKMKELKKQVEKLMSFDGLRSHLKSSHSIKDIRDEDIYSRVDEVSQPSHGNSTLEQKDGPIPL